MMKFLRVKQPGNNFLKDHLIPLSLKGKITECWLAETEGIISSIKGIFGNQTLCFWPGLFSDFGWE